MQNYQQYANLKRNKNPIEILNDIIDPRNYPYYADVLARSGIRIGEFGARLLPATGKLISDLIQKPAFKVKSTEDNYVRDYMNVYHHQILKAQEYSQSF